MILVIPFMLGFMITGWIIYFAAVADEVCSQRSLKNISLIKVDRVVLMIQLLQLIYIGYGLYEIIKPACNRYKARR